MSRAGLVHDAVRREAKGRIALAGPAGAGKTWTALTVATTLAAGAPIVVIDTERESAELYADHFRFRSLAWDPPYDPRELAETIKDLGKDYGVIVVDSGSHFWSGEGGTLDIVDAAGQRSQGNRFAGWKVGTPAQEDLVEAMLKSPAHVIFCMRSKMEYVQEKDEKTGRTVVRKIGMAPVQRDQIEFEFTVTADLDMEHRLLISKTRCHLLADRMYAPGRADEMATTLAEWLKGGEPVAAAADVAQLTARMNALPEEPRKICKRLFVECFGRPDHLLASRLGEASTFVADYEKAPDPEPPKADPPGPPAAPASDAPAAGTNGTKTKAPKYARDLHVRASKVFEGDKSKVADAKLDALVLNVTDGRTTSTGDLNETEAASVATWLNEVDDGRVRVEADDPAEGVTLWVGDTPTYFPRSAEGFLVAAEALA